MTQSQVLSALPKHPLNTDQKHKYISYNPHRLNPWRLVLRGKDYGYFFTVDKAIEVRDKLMFDLGLSKTAPRIDVPALNLTDEVIEAKSQVLRAKTHLLELPVVTPPDPTALYQMRYDKAWVALFSKNYTEYKAELALRQQALTDAEAVLKELIKSQYANEMESTRRALENTLITYEQQLLQARHDHKREVAALHSKLESTTLELKQQYKQDQSRLEAKLTIAASQLRLL